MWYNGCVWDILPQGTVFKLDKVVSEAILGHSRLILTLK